jgi:hypothetical protein
MNQRTLRIPGTLKHTSDEQTDVALQEKAREHAERYPGVRFLADVLRALHAPGALIRSAKGFYGAFAPREVMEALAQRPDLRVKTVKAITGGAPTLLRRLPPEALASQIDLLVIEDLPEAERSVRAEIDRTLTVHDLYLKYLDPDDLATYLSLQSIWTYESQDSWWKKGAHRGYACVDGDRAASIRRHGVLTDARFWTCSARRHWSSTCRSAVRTGLRRPRAGPPRQESRSPTRTCSRAPAAAGAI